jgi:predicted glycosyltransferase
MFTFPTLKFYTLPSYDIHYTFKSFFLNIGSQFFKGLKTRKAENASLNKILKDEPNISLIISDNRFGCYHSNIKSIFITHQLKPYHSLKVVRWVSAFFMKIMTAPFSEIWVPDYGPQSKRISGGLCDDSNIPQPVKYIGPLSRLSKTEEEIEVIKNQVLILLSGPEPQRTFLEKELLKIFSKHKDKKVVLIRGKMDDTLFKEYDHIDIIPFTSGQKLANYILQAETIICRSGYSTIMDLLHLEKQAILIPTPGQTEQEYLAVQMSKNHGWKWIDQKKIDQLVI